jgi:hypothetical protein
VSDRAPVTLVLEDGSSVSPRLDPDGERRARYLVDNLLSDATGGGDETR